MAVKCIDMLHYGIRKVFEVFLCVCVGAIESCSKLGSSPGTLEKLRNAMDPSKEPSENLEEGEVTFKLNLNVNICIHI